MWIKQKEGWKAFQIRSGHCGGPHYCTWQILMPRNEDLEPIFELVVPPSTKKKVLKVRDIVNQRLDRICAKFWED